MHRKQRGITLIGWIFLLIPIAIVGYAVIRLIPIYLNYTKVARVMSQLDDTVDAGTPLGGVKVALQNRLDIESVEFPGWEDFGVRRDGQTWIVQAAYEDNVPLFSNISLRVVFDKEVRIGADGDGEP